MMSKNRFFSTFFRDITGWWSILPSGKRKAIICVSKPISGRFVL